MVRTPSLPFGLPCLDPNSKLRLRRYFESFVDMRYLQKLRFLCELPEGEAVDARPLVALDHLEFVDLTEAFVVHCDSLAALPRLTHLLLPDDFVEGEAVLSRLGKFRAFVSSLFGSALP